MSEHPWWRRPALGAAAVLATLAYLPALTAAPGRMPADSKLYLYLDPGRFLADAAGSFDPRQFAGWVPHQHIAYLWPSGPWFWLFDALGVPDWIAHRLWIGSLLVAAGLGVRWCARTLGLSHGATLSAALVYQLSLYVLPYVSRTSVMLLPWAGLGWIVGATVRATQRRTWTDPAIIALIVLTVGAVNATALAMIVPGPLIWLVHAPWARLVSWRSALMVALRVGVLCVATSLWWIAMLVIQGRYGVDVLPYSESLADVSLTATSAEVWRGLGYWLLYVRDPYAATTTETLRYLTSTPAIAVSYAVPVVALAGVVWTRWLHRRFAVLLVGCGVVLAVGVHPIGDRSPLMRLVAGGDDGGLALALRSSTRALPLVLLGFGLGAAALVDAAAPAPRWRFGAVAIRRDHALVATVAALTIVNLPSLWTGAFVDPALERDEDPPGAWLAAASALDATPADGRVLQLPGAEFGAFRWGYTVDQPLPGLIDRPVVTRDLLPLGSPGAMDLLYALDDRFQDGVADERSIAPVARLLGVDTIWLANDIAFDRFRTARPDVVRDVVLGADGVGPAAGFGEPVVAEPTVAMTDGRALADPRVGRPVRPVELAPVDGRIVRASATDVVVSGSGDGLVDLAATGLVDGTEAIRYSASLADPSASLADAEALLVTDSNRSQARHWRSSQDTRGYTESSDPDLALLRAVDGDERLPVFERPPTDAVTWAEQEGAVAATATAYGEPFAYLPERRPAMAVDGDPGTAWTVGEHGDPVGETLLLTGALGTRVTLLQPTRPGDRRIVEVELAAEPVPLATPTVALDDRSIGEGQPVELPPGTTSLAITITAVGGGEVGTPGAVAGVGFAEVGHAGGPTREVVVVPRDATSVAPQDVPLAYSLTRWRVDPLDRWRADPEPTLIRSFDVPDRRSFAATVDVRLDPRAPDASLASLFGWPVGASVRLSGSLRSVGAAAFDGDPATSWTTPFGGARDATLTVSGGDEPIDRIEVVQSDRDLTRVDAVSLRVGDDERLVELPPDGSPVAIDPPLPSGELSIRIAAVTPATTVDRRYGDVVELPASISEIRFPGAPTVDLRTGPVLECVPLVEVGGQQLRATIEIDDWFDRAVDGQALAAEPCDATVTLDAGEQLATATVTGLPLTLDRLVLDDGARAAVGVADIATATLVDRSRFGRTIEVAGCPRGCWLTIGEGWNEAWAAEADRVSLGPPQLVDGGFAGWWIPPVDGSTTVDVRWTAQRPITIALLLSVAGAIAAIALVVVGVRRRPPPAEGAPRPRWAWESADARPAWLVVAVWTLSTLALVGPGWAVLGLAAGLVHAWRPRRRLGELVAVASVAVAGAAVAAVERRDAPFPNGGWPTTFESLHPIGMFAAAALVSAALLATDARAERRSAGDTGDDRVSAPPS